MVTLSMEVKLGILKDICDLPASYFSKIDFARSFYFMKDL